MMQSSTHQEVREPDAAATPKSNSSGSPLMFQYREARIDADFCRLQPAQQQPQYGISSSDIFAAKGNEDDEDAEQTRQSNSRQRSDSSSEASSSSPRLRKGFLDWPDETELLESTSLVEGWKNVNDDETDNTAAVASVRPVPVHYPLAPHVVSFPPSQLSRVCDALTYCFYNLSLRVEYQDGDGTKKTVKAYCESMQGVKLVVQIWKRPMAKRLDSGKTPEDMDVNMDCLVEILRLGGDQMEFSPLVRNILQSIQDSIGSTESSTPSPPSSPTVSFSPKRSASTKIPADSPPMDPLGFTKNELLGQERRFHTLMRDSVEIHNIQTSELTLAPGSLQFTLEHCEKLLVSPLCDNIHKGLTKLVSLTDPNRSGYTTAKKVATQVLCNVNSKTSEIVLFLALDRSWPTSMDMSADDLRLHMEMRKKHSYLALTIMAQSLSLIDANDLSDCLQVVSRWDLLTVEPLVHFVQHAAVAPHVAYLATHILACLCRWVPEIRARVDRHHHSVVLMAQHIGTCNHAALAQASDRLLNELLIVDGRG